MFRSQARKPLNPVAYEDNNRDLELLGQAQQLFQRSYFRGKLNTIRSKLTGKPSRLLNSTDLEATKSTVGRYDSGIQVVSLDKICGSEDRVGDFDRSFNPLQDRTRSRWLRIAMASLQGVTLPPVKLIKIGETYLVRDGHHRVSVARALGQTFIDAEVTVWQVKQFTGRERSTLTSRPLCQGG